MKTSAGILTLCLSSVAMAATAYAADLPRWAYPLNPPVVPGTQPPKDDGTPKHVPGSNIALTRTQIAGRDGVPDWHPDDHPTMPDVVNKGRMPEVRACGYCHTPSGAGRPENASLAGLTPAYIKQQVMNFRNSDRKGSEPKRVPQNLMMGIAQHVTDAEVEQAAAYFSSIKPVSSVKIVEAGTVPKTTVVGGMMAKAPEGGMEPIAGRIIEVPDDTERAELRDDKTTFTAFVPLDALKKGEALVATGGNGKTLQCGICHGADLKGLGDVPRIAGRSPSFLMRQLYDIQNGTRSGSAVLMKQVVAKLDNDDMVAIAAYVASRVP
ncbi:MAG TPA: c-type cytochrome [Micropepsaceae bacterium]